MDLRTPETRDLAFCRFAGDPVRIGQIMRVVRERRGMVQEEVARRLKITRMAVSNWECGNNLPRVYLWARWNNLMGKLP